MKKRYKFVNIVLLVYLGIHIPYILAGIVSYVFGYDINLGEFVDGIIYFNIPYLLPSGWPNTAYMKIVFGILQTCTVFSYFYISIIPDTKKIWVYIGIPAIIIYLILFIFTSVFLLGRWG